VIILLYVECSTINPSRGHFQIRESRQNEKMQNPKTFNLATYIRFDIILLMSSHFENFRFRLRCVAVQMRLLLCLWSYYLRSKYSWYLSSVYFTTHKSTLKWLSSDSDLLPKSYPNNIKTKQTKKKQQPRELYNTTCSILTHINSIKILVDYRRQNKICVMKKPPLPYMGGLEAPRRKRIHIYLVIYSYTAVRHYTIMYTSKALNNTIKLQLSEVSSLSVEWLSCNIFNLPPMAFFCASQVKHRPQIT